MVRLTDHLAMTIDVDWDVKPQQNTTQLKLLILTEVNEALALKQYYTQARFYTIQLFTGCLTV